MAVTILNIPLTKVDAEKRIVYGVAALEVPDRGARPEIFDYETSKVHFQGWSDGIFKSAEKIGAVSYGNIRAMHGTVAAGKVCEPLGFNDDLKQIECAAHIVDDNEWKKVTEGVYTGFSIGGDYVKRWDDEIDGQKLKRYTAKPVEISLVDLPCMPGAEFELIRSSGAHEMRKFVSTAHVGQEIIMTQKPNQVAGVVPPNGDDVTKALGVNPDITNEMVHGAALELAKAAGVDTSKWSEFIADARHALEIEMGSGDLTKNTTQGAARVGATVTPSGQDTTHVTAQGTANANVVGTATTRQSATQVETGNTTSNGGQGVPTKKAAMPEQVWKAADGSTFETKEAARAHNDYLASPAYEAVQKATQAADSTQQKKESGKGAAQGDEAGITDRSKNGGGTTDESEDAGKPKLDTGKDQKAKSSTDKTPETGANGDATQPRGASKKDPAEKGTPAGVKKGLYACGRLLSLIDDLNWMQQASAGEEAREGDKASTVPGSLKANIASLIVTARAMVEEETSELLDGEDVESVLLMMSATPDLNRDLATMTKFSKVWATTEPLQKNLLPALEKAGKRNSAADQNRVQAMHDHSIHLGAKCDGDNCDDAEKSAGGSFAKAAVASLEYQNTMMAKSLAHVTQLLETIGSQSANPPARTYAIVDKSADGDMQDGEGRQDGASIGRNAARNFLKSADPDTLATAAIGLIHRAGGHKVGFGSR